MRETKRAINAALCLWVSAGFVTAAGLLIGAFLNFVLYLISMVFFSAVVWALFTGWWLLPWTDKQAPSSRS